MKNKTPWISNPTKKQTLLTFFVWLIGTVLSILAMTNLFSENPFKQGQFGLWILFLFSTAMMLKVCLSYMRNRNINKLVLALKICLLLIIATFAFDFISGFVVGWNEVMLNQPNLPRKFSHAKETLAVKPINDTVIYESKDYSITGIRSFQYQEKNIDHSTSFSVIIVVKLIIGFGALIFLYRFIKNSFALLNRFQKLSILEKDNLELLNKTAINLLLSGILINLFVLINFFLNLSWFHFPGYQLDYSQIGFDFSYIIIALIILTLSWILKFGIELKEEQDLTV